VNHAVFSKDVIEVLVNAMHSVFYLGTWTYFETNYAYGNILKMLKSRR